MTKMSPRQSEILELLSQGYTYKEISWRLKIGDRTIKEHVYKAKLKLEAQSVIQTVVLYKLLPTDGYTEAT